MITLTLQLLIVAAQLICCGLFTLGIGMPYTNFIAIWGVVPVIILGMMK